MYKPQDRRNNLKMEGSQMKRMLCLLAALALALTAMVVPAALAEENDNWLDIFYTDDL